MKTVINHSNQPVPAVIDGEYFRFNARERKVLPLDKADHPDLDRYPTLKIVGVYQDKQLEEPTTTEINSQSDEHDVTLIDSPETENAQVLIEPIVVDDKKEQTTDLDMVLEEKPKPRRRRKKEMKNED